MIKTTGAIPNFEVPVCLMCPFLDLENRKVKMPCDKIHYRSYMDETMLPKKCQKTVKGIWVLYNVNKMTNWKELISLLHGVKIY